MTDQERSRVIIQTGATTFLIWGAIYAFFSADLLPYANARDLYELGGAAAAGCGTAYITANLPRDRHYPVLVVLGLLLAAGFLIRAALLAIDVEADAEAVARANDVRCAAIQSDMLSARPRMTDGPAVFQALRCGPSGSEARILVRPTDRELRAGRALPGGGYIRP